MRNRQNQKNRLVYLFLSLAWMAVIFWFSAQNGEASGEKSTFFSTLLHIPEWNVRKGAHMAEYAVLAGLLLGFFSTFKLACIWRRLAAWGVSVLYAATDEFHQMFSGGRTASMRDVCIDAAGAALGILAVFVIRLIYGRLSTDKGKE